MKLALAGCVILDDQNKVLLLHRNTAKRQQWEVPGGKVEAGEDPEQTAKREVKEELDVDASIRKLLGRKEFIEDNFTMSYSWYLADVQAGRPKIKEPYNFDKLDYFSIEQMKNIYQDLSPNTQNLIPTLERNLSNKV